jgi:hypothetical protein
MHVVEVDDTCRRLTAALRVCLRSRFRDASPPRAPERGFQPHADVAGRRSVNLLRLSKNMQLERYSVRIKPCYGQVDRRRVRVKGNAAGYGRTALTATRRRCI